MAALSSRFQVSRIQAVLFLDSLPDKNGEPALETIAKRSRDDQVRRTATKCFFGRSSKYADLGHNGRQRQHLQAPGRDLLLAFQADAE